MRGLLFIGFLTLLAAPSLRAQHAVVSFEQWEPSQVAAAGGQPSAAVMPHRDYRYEGLVVGGLALGGARRMDWLANHARVPYRAGRAMRHRPAG